MNKIVQMIDTLRQKSTPVESVQEAKGIIAKLEAGFPENGIGLAAIQIGIPKQVAYTKYGGKVSYLINPEIIDKQDEFVFCGESCLSFPGVSRDTNRYKQITIRNQVIDGDHFREETQSYYYSPDTEEAGNDGLLAIAVQHEIDHFSGRLLIDYNIRIEPIRNVIPKVGRNDPCHCGSGKKFKKCCLK